jgi:spectinomycin phosphotransferase
VLAEPRDLDRGELKAVLRHWGLNDPKLEYLPVGFGSHHWEAVDAAGERRFVSVDDLDAPFQAGPDRDGSFDALERAYKTTARLRDEAGLEFVVAPLRDDEGRLTRRLGDRYAVNVAPFLTGEPQASSQYESAEERRRMGTLLGRLHAATEMVPPDLPRREDFVLHSRADLEEALRDLDVRWDFGPFSESMRELLRACTDGLERVLQAYDGVAAAVSGRSEPWVVTHGEPHRKNTIRAGDAVQLVDWDTTLIAPRERDLRMVLDENLIGLDEYRAVVGHVPFNREAVRLYDLWWEIDDISGIVAIFRKPHEQDEQTVASWEILRRSLTLYTG